MTRTIPSHRTLPALAAVLLSALLPLGGCDDTDAPPAPTAADKPQGYVETLLASKDKANATVDAQRLRTLSTYLTVYAVDRNSKFPPSLQDLVEKVDLATREDILTPDGRPLQYVAGQSMHSPGQSVLAYDDQPRYGGKHLVLLVGAEVTTLTPDELQSALAKTRASLAAAPTADE